MSDVKVITMKELEKFGELWMTSLITGICITPIDEMFDDLDDVERDYISKKEFEIYKSDTKEMFDKYREDIRRNIREVFRN